MFQQGISCYHLLIYPHYLCLSSAVSRYPILVKDIMLSFVDLSLLFMLFFCPAVNRLSNPSKYKSYANIRKCHASTGEFQTVLVCPVLVLVNFKRYLCTPC